MPKYQFLSPGAVAGDALSQELIRRETLKRQMMLDELARKQAEAQMVGADTSRQLQQDQFAYMQKRDVAEDEFRNTQSRTAAQERAAAAEADKAWKEEQAALNRTTAAEQKNLDRESKIELARLAAALGMSGRETSEALKRIQAEAAEDKLEATRAERAKSETERSAARTDVSVLAQELKSDPLKNRAVGPLQGRIPTLRGDTKDFDNRVNRLKAMLSLENRSKLKGSGAISDFEARTLEQAATALDQRTDEASFDKALDLVIKATGGGAASGGSRKRYNPATGQIE